VGNFVLKVSIELSSGCGKESLGYCVIQIIIPLVSSYAIFLVQAMGDIVFSAKFTYDTPQIIPASSKEKFF
jgi:hypothetical protein